MDPSGLASIEYCSKEFIDLLSLVNTMDPSGLASTEYC